MLVRSRLWDAKTGANKAPTFGLPNSHDQKPSTPWHQQLPRHNEAAESKAKHQARHQVGTPAATESQMPSWPQWRKCGPREHEPTTHQQPATTTRTMHNHQQHPPNSKPPATDNKKTNGYRKSKPQLALFDMAVPLIIWLPLQLRARLPFKKKLGPTSQCTVTPQIEQLKNKRKQKRLRQQALHVNVF